MRSYTGPLYAHLDIPVPDQVRAFLAGRRPVIYAAITSSTPDLVRQVVRALEPTGARILVAATTHDLADLASGQVMVAGVLPSHRVMGDADLAVIAGGQGSVQTALAASCPGPCSCGRRPVRPGGGERLGHWLAGRATRSSRLIASGIGG